jgi:hypothetical protein
MAGCESWRQGKRCFAASGAAAGRTGRSLIVVDASALLSSSSPSSAPDWLVGRPVSPSFPTSSIFGNRSALGAIGQVDSWRGTEPSKTSWLYL